MLVNLDKYNSPPPAYQVMLGVACNDGNIRTMAEAGAKQIPALEELKRKGVQVHRWPDDTLALMRAHWDDIMAEKSAADPLFKKVADSYLGFRKTYSLWKELQRLP